ncbi:MAG: SAVED domain-containing protein, partial [bacterium]
GLKLANLPLTPCFWQAHGPANQQVWLPFGVAHDHRDRLLRTADEEAVEKHRPVALFVEITHRVNQDEAVEGLRATGAEAAHVVRLQPDDVGYEAVVDARTAQQAAADLYGTLGRLGGKASALHVFYVGPVSVLMMAAGVLRVAGTTTIYERISVGGRWLFWPSLCFEGGEGRWHRGGGEVRPA